VSALRIATRDGVRLVDLGPSNGVTRTRYGIPGGSIVRPAIPALNAEELERQARRRASNRAAVDRYQARRRAEA
jgi:hypothetical protein